MKDENKRDQEGIMPEQERSELPVNETEVPETEAFELEAILEEYMEQLEGEEPAATDEESSETESPEGESESAHTEEAAPMEPEEEEPEDTARFIQEQVNMALGDTYSAKTLREQEERAAQMRKARERQAAKEAKEQRREKRIRALQKMMHRHKNKIEQTEDAPAEKADNVIQMPVSKLKPLRDTINNLNEKARNYADEMYEGSEMPGLEVEPEENERTETNVEKPPQKRKVRMERKPRRLYKPEPDIPPAELAKRYGKGLKNMRVRMGWLLALCVAMFYFTIASDGSLPLPVVLKDQPKLVAAILLWCLGVACLLGLDTLWMGLTAPRRKRTGTHTIMAFGIAITLLDGLWFCMIGRGGGLPFAAPAALSLLGTMWGTYDRKKGLAKTCATASLSASPYRVTLDQDKWKGRSAFSKELGTTEQFGSQVQSPDGSIRVYQFSVPLLLVAVGLFAIISSFGRMHPERFLWCLSVILTAATPLAGMLAYSQPYLRLTRRLNSSVALAGWDGVLSMEEGEAYILIRDDDLFPVGSIKAQGIKTFQGVAMERVTSCAASMIRASGSGLTKLFSDLVQVQGGFFRRVDSLSYHEAGGLVATIRGDQVMIGTAGFMTVMHIPLKHGEYVKEAIFCAINGNLQGIFTLKYDQSRNVRPALQALIQARVKPVLATRDFNITPAMLHRRFKLPVNKMEYPNVRRRHELSEPGQAHNRILGALVRRDGLGPYTDAIVGARRLRQVVRWNTILALVASGIGAILTFYLTFIGAYLSLCALNMMLFQLLWLVPNLLISAAVDKF